ncbi:alpha/beta hydrolase family protein [Moheibacter stercoris]|uniref:Dipeptidyl aminopeptidase/acylaminoacyl peptidase n=1 Tax=Moheibacter stercoris TaxID=1628251 RepID=A0ABV2LSQ9_9FLAO
MRKLILLLIIGGILAEILSAQDKIYTSNLDSLWSKDVYISYTSPKGDWVVLKEVFDTKEDSYFLKDIKNSKEILLGNSSFISFSNNNNWFSYITSENKLVLKNLINNDDLIIDNISSYEFSSSGEYLTAIQKEKNQLIVFELKSGNQYKFKNIVEYKWCPNREVILISNNNDIILFNADTTERIRINKDDKSVYTNLQWSISGNSIAFFEKKNDNYTMHFYKHITLDKFEKQVLHRKLSGYNFSQKQISISNDDKRVFFFVQNNSQITNNDKEIEIWDTKSPWIYPKMQDYLRETSEFLNVWNIETNKIVNITNTKLPSYKLSPDNNNVYLFNKLTYEPQYKQSQVIDLYSINVHSGNIEKVVQELYNFFGFYEISPSGRFVVYFKNNDWWIYDCLEQSTINLTNDLHINFFNPQDIALIDKQPYGHPGWLKDESYIILYDKYDIWFMSPDGKIKKKITDGRRDGTTYRIDLNINRNEVNFINTMKNNTSFEFDIKSPVVLKYSNDKVKGFALLKEDSIEVLVNSHLNIGDGLLSTEKNIFFYKTFNLYSSPKIYSYNFLNKKENIIYESNPNFKNYDFGKYKPINFKNKTSNELKCTLLYPAQFNPQKKYPMITWIYEKSSSSINYFSPPSKYSELGFNFLSYVTNGYFILLPDIEYKQGDPGISALESVTNIVDNILEFEPAIDNKNIGIIGHSFGGYEAAFIATQTNLFKTAVAGAAVTDLISWSHNVSWIWKMNQFWRPESHQFRIGESYYELKENYYKNSPFHQVENLNVPLLLWAGKNDFNINWEQSLYMFMAMKRLNKEGVFVSFNNESHTILNNKNKRKLSEIIFRWFDRYLKEKE